MYVRIRTYVASATIPIAEMLDQLSWHRKQLQAGIICYMHVY